MYSLDCFFFLLYGGSSLIWFYFQKVRIFSFECNVMANIFRFPFSKNKECARVAWKRPQVYFDSHLFLLLLSSGQESGSRRGMRSIKNFETASEDGAFCTKYIVLLHSCFGTIIIQFLVNTKG